MTNREEKNKIILLKILLFVYILKQRRKDFADFKKQIADFQEFNFFYKIKNL